MQRKEQKFEKISVTLTLPEGIRERIHANGETVNGYINRLILADLERLENKEPFEQTREPPEMAVFLLLVFCQNDRIVQFLLQCNTTATHLQQGATFLQRRERYRDRIYSLTLYQNNKQWDTVYTQCKVLIYILYPHAHGVILYIASTWNF